MVTATIDQTIIPGTSSRFDFIERVKKTVVDVMEPVMPTTDGIKTSERYFINVIPTSSQTVGDDLINIDFYANQNDVDKFIETVNSLDLETLPARSIIHIIDLALSIGLVKLPQDLSQHALQIYPEDKEIIKYQKILAPPKIINSKLPPYPQAELNVKWLKEFRNEYKGKWVALKDGVLLASSVSFEELKSQVDLRKNSHILVTRV